MKRFLAFAAMLVASPLVFAGTEMVSCESDNGKCTFTLSSESLSKECVCRDGREVSESEMFPEGGSASSALPTEEECEAELLINCQNAGIKCENVAGECHLEQNGEYSCRCYGIEGMNTGSGIYSEKACNDTLVEICGTEAMTARKICTDAGFLDVCVSYIEKIKNTCFDPINGIDDILDAPLDYSDLTAQEIADCCQYEDYRNEYKNEFECLEASKTCETCVDMPFDEDSENSGKEDASNTEAPTTGTTPEDTADGDSSAPATDEAPAENKEESKSDGCSMLFI